MIARYINFHFIIFTYLSKIRTLGMVHVKRRKKHVHMSSTQLSTDLKDTLRQITAAETPVRNR